MVRSESITDILQERSALRARIAELEGERERMKMDLATQVLREGDIVNTLRQERLGHQERVERLEAEREAAKAEAEAALKASGENAKAWINCVNDGSLARTQLGAEIGLGEQRIKQLEADLDSARAGESRAVEALRKVAAITNQLGPDRPSAQYMAESAHRIATAALARLEVKPCPA